MRPTGLWRVTLGLSALLLIPVLAFGDAERDIKKKLVAGLKAQDVSVVREAMDEAAALEGAAGAEVILDKAIPIGLLGLVEEMVEALAKVKDTKELVKAAEKHKVPDIRYLAIRALAGRAKDDDEVRKVCTEALEDKSEVVAVAAVRATQRFVTKEIVDAYISLLEKEEEASSKKQRPALMRELVTALQNVTEQDIDAALDWKNYWESHRAEWRAPETVTGSDDDVISRMKEHRRSDVRTLERMPKAAVVVMRGRSDKVEKVLDAIKIEHTLIDRDDLFKSELDPKSVLILNCNGNKDLFTDEELQKLSIFVAKGGYLFSSDWQLKFTIEKAFPGTIAFGGETKRDEEPEVGILPTLPNHPYMRDVFPLSTLERLGFKWKLDSRSHLIDVKGRGVMPLIECPELKEQYRHPYTAATFRWNGRLVADTRVATGGKEGKLEGGAVLHVLGHFKNQMDKSDKFALQQLLLNFILEKRREVRLGDD